jgi:hypothetical protein
MYPCIVVIARSSLRFSERSRLLLSSQSCAVNGRCSDANNLTLRRITCCVSSSSHQWVARQTAPTLVKSCVQLTQKELHDEVIYASVAIRFGSYKYVSHPIHIVEMDTASREHGFWKRCERPGYMESARRPTVCLNSSNQVYILLRRGVQFFLGVNAWSAMKVNSGHRSSSVDTNQVLPVHP